MAASANENGPFDDYRGVSSWEVFWDIVVVPSLHFGVSTGVTDGSCEHSDTANASGKCCCSSFTLMLARLSSDFGGFDDIDLGISVE